MQHTRPTLAGLAALATVQTVMLSSLFAGVPPHPPKAIPLFAMGPFLGAALACCAAAAILLPARAGQALAVLAALMALVSFGPQKYLDPALPLIWPAVLGAQAAALTIILSVLRQFRTAPDQTTRTCAT